MARPLRTLSDIPDPVPAKEPTAADAIAIVNAVAKGMPLESAVRLLCSLGMGEEDARRMCDPAAASYETSQAPAPAETHIHVPESAIRVEVEKAEPARVTLPPMRVVVEPAPVVVQPAEARPRIPYRVSIQRGDDGLVSGAMLEPLE